MQAPPSRPPYLFFSPRCPHSNQLIEMIKRNPTLTKRIEPINVHTARSLPPQLDGVPAILFGGQLLVGPDTFKWVQFQTPQRNNDRENGGRQQEGMPGGGMQGGMQHGGMQQGMPQGGMQQEEMGIPMPSDISSDTKHGIDFTPLPGQDFNKADATMPNFSYLPGEGKQSDGTVGIDYEAAMDISTATKNKGAGVAQQLERLQQMRGLDQDNMREQADGMMQGYSRGGGQGGGGGQYQQGGGGQYQQGGGGQYQQQMQNQYEVPPGPRGGYGGGGEDMPKRW